MDSQIWSNYLNMNSMDKVTDRMKIGISMDFSLSILES